MAVTGLPRHLERYVVDQDYSRYTPVDQAVWRHIMRQLRSFLAVHAHPCYLEGLAKTGIEVDRIPRIDVMNEKLEKFGWRAVPVSGFIPPAAFMELQSLGYLPIASDMRSVDHLLYTPAPDIVHEAAGHAPILVDPAFAQYLKSYAQVARKAILSRDDFDQYEAIRILSDIKEDPDSTPAQIKQAEERLANVTAAMKETSEAAILGRMNWWTAEYGLIGSLENPKIFGAGLLSSVGESRAAISAAVKKIPLTIDCINYAYDITEQQPQLFVVKKFEDLEEVLEQLARTMAFRVGGIEALEKAVRSRTVNTVELDSGLQISGTLKSYRRAKVGGRDRAVYLSFEGPTQLATHGHELPGQGIGHHTHGFGSPLGRALTKVDGKPSAAGAKVGDNVTLEFESGVVVTGRLEKETRDDRGRDSSSALVILTFSNARVTHGSDLLFDPAWGTYDMAVGHDVVSVYAGPADRAAFGETDDFTKKLVPKRIYDEPTLNKHLLYSEVRALREGRSNKMLEDLVERADKVAPKDWLLHSELLELAEDAQTESTLIHREQERLQHIGQADPAAAQHIGDALKTLHLKG